jgi:6-phosphogluconolactonase/glucosamine-6-phosphate isomerase/deaminase
MKVFDKIDVDLSLLTRTPENDDERQRQAILLKVQAFCDQFEERVRALGGIGFFLGGIGPDGHIAFNQEGSAHDCKTRLVSFNYPTAAAAASDLGGIEKARGKAAMTIGLQTITYNRNAKIIIMAAGEGKANVIRAGIEDPASEERPSSVLHGLPNARFYITHGAALKLTKRKIEKVKGISEKVLSWALVHLAGTDNPDHPHLVEASIEYSLMESMVYDLSLQFKTPVHELSLEKVGSRAGEVLPDWLMANPLAFQLLCATASRRLKEKVQGGLKESSLIDTRILHTAPHHDDIMLSYHGAMHDMLGRQEAGTVFDPALAPPEDNQKRTPRAASQRARAGSFTAAYTENNLGESFNANVNHFAYLTSGFHSVNDDFLWAKVNGVLGPWQGMEGTVFLEEAVAMGQLTREYDQLMSDFRKAFLAKDEVTQDHIENIIFLRKIAEVWRNSLSDNYKVLCEQLRKEVEWIKNDYLLAHMPGDAVPK